MLEREYDFFQANQEELLRKYPGKFIAIVGEDVVAVGDTLADVIKATIPNHPAGTFLVQEISENEATRVQRFYSRVYV